MIGGECFGWVGTRRLSRGRADRGACVEVAMQRVDVPVELPDRIGADPSALQLDDDGPTGGVLAIGVGGDGSAPMRSGNSTGTSTRWSATSTLRRPSVGFSLPPL